MMLKALSIILYINLASFALGILLPIKPEKSSKENFLNVLKRYNPTDVVYVFDEVKSEEWSGDIYRVFEPVYTINLAKKGTLFREYSLIKDNDTVLNNENLYIISMRDFSLFEEVVDNIRRLVFWKARQRLIFITKNDTVTPDDFTRCFKYCFKYWMINIAVTFIDNLEVTYTYNPFEDNYLILKNISEVFFDKTIDLHGFRLNVTIFPVILNAREVDGKYDGIDGWMSRVVMGTIKASYDYVVPSEGAVYGNYNATSADGALGDVVLGRTQVGFNSRFFRERLYKVAEMTYSHRRNDLVVLVPIERSNTLKNIFAMTSPLTWALVLGLSILIFFYVFKFNKYLDFGTIITDIVLVVTGKPIHDFTFNKFRILFMSSMVLMFYITVEFNCRLTSVLTISITPPRPRTLNDLWASTHYKIRSRPSYATNLKNFVDVKMGKRLMNRAVGLDRDIQIDEIMKCKKEIIICQHDIARTAIKMSLVKDRNYCYRRMREIFLPNVQVYVVPYGSPFLLRFDDIIRRLRDSGIFAYWEKGPFTYRRGERSQEPYRLSFDTLFVAFVVLELGLTISTLVFVYEYRSVQSQK